MTPTTFALAGPNIRGVLAHFLNQRCLMLIFNSANQQAMRFSASWILCIALTANAEETSSPPPPLVTTPSSHLEMSARERQAGTLGVGLIGLSSFSTTSSDLAGLGSLGGLAYSAPSVPLLGIRYWMKSSRMGIDVGVGAMVASNPTLSTSSSPGIQLHAHVGLPIAIASGVNVIALIAPELRVGLKSVSVNSSLSGAETNQTGSLLELGVRGGLELYFGFIGVPELSLEASFRVAAAREAFTSGSSQQSEKFRFSTSLAGDAFSLLASSLALKYYF